MRNRQRRTAGRGRAAWHRILFGSTRGFYRGAGADIIVGSHAHVLLGAGYQQGKFVDYGLGNFVFYTRGDITARSGVLFVTASQHQVDSYKFQPVQIVNGIPRPFSPEASTSATQAWNDLRTCTVLDK